VAQGPIFLRLHMHARMVRRRGRPNLAGQIIWIIGWQQKFTGDQLPRPPKGVSTGWNGCYRTYTRAL